MAQWVKDLALLQLWRRLQLWCGFHLWPGNFHGYLDFRLLVSRNVREEVSVVLSHPIFVTVLQPQETNKNNKIVGGEGSK